VEARMVDLLDDGPTPRQSPTLTDLQVAQARAAWIRQVEILFLMASEDAPDVEVLLAQLINRPGWHQQAACRGVDPDLFFPERGRSTAAALAYCEGCEVRAQCLSTALAVPTMGVWGGTTGRSRRVLRRGVA
jgi:WhiB family redox-sensing transcriptional regulator